MVGIFRNASSSPQYNRREWLKVATAPVVASLVSSAEALVQYPHRTRFQPESVNDFMRKHFFNPLESLRTNLPPEDQLISILEKANDAFKQITRVYPNLVYRQREALRALTKAIDKETEGLMSSLNIQTITDLGYLYNSFFINNMNIFRVDVYENDHSIESQAAWLNLEPRKVNLFIKCTEGKPISSDAIPFITKLLGPLDKPPQKAEVFAIDDLSLPHFGLARGLEIFINKPRIQELAEFLEISYKEVEKLALANEYMHIALKHVLNPKSFGDSSEEPLIVKDVIPGITFYTNVQANEFLSDVASINEQPRDIVRILGLGTIGYQDGYYATEQFARKITNEFCDAQGIKKLYYNFDGRFKTLKQHFNDEKLLQEYLSYVCKRYAEVGTRIVKSIRANQEQLPLRVTARVLPAQ